MAKEALERILSTESEAKNVLNTARDEAKKLITQAKDAVLKQREDEIQRCKKETASKEAALRKEVQAELDLILDTAKIDCKRLTEQAEERALGAKDFLKERIMN